MLDLMKLCRFFIFLLLSVTLAGCNFSLSADVPPPSNYQPVVADQAQVSTASLPNPGASDASTPQPAVVVTAPITTTQTLTNTQAIASSSPITATQTTTTTVQIGKVTGKVTNTSGGMLPLNTTVTLNGFDQGATHVQIVITQTATLSADGSFTFPQVAMSAGRIFLATLEYQGATYASEALPVEAGVISLDLPIQIYETTTDTSVLVIDRLHLFFEQLDEQTIRIVELYIISNPTTKTVTASNTGEPIVAFTLPADATNLQFQDGSLGDRYLQTSDGFADTIPVQPGQGQYQVVYAFDLPFKNKAELIQPLLLPANAVIVLTPINSIRISGANLQDGGVRKMGEQDYQTYNGTALQAGQELRLTISGAPFWQGLSISTGASTNLAIGIGALGFVLIILGLLLYRRSRQVAAQASLNSNGLLPVPVTDNAEAVMDAILALDDLYQAGKLSPEAYLKRRGELKQRLKELSSGGS